MKKLFIISLLLLSFVLTSQAQKRYSLENLEKLSQEELDLYLEKALKKNKIGKKLVTVSAISIGAATIYAILDPFDHELGALVPFGIAVYLGVPAITVGIPMQIVNKKRVGRINGLKNTGYNGIKIDLKPCAQYNFVSQNYQPGITLRIKF